MNDAQGLAAYLYLFAHSTVCHGMTAELRLQTAVSCPEEHGTPQNCSIATAEPFVNDMQSVKAMLATNSCVLTFSKIYCRGFAPSLGCLHEMPNQRNSLLPFRHSHHVCTGIVCLVSYLESCLLIVAPCNFSHTQTAQINAGLLAPSTLYCQLVSCAKLLKQSCLTSASGW